MRAPPALALAALAAVGAGACSGDDSDAPDDATAAVDAVTPDTATDTTTYATTDTTTPVPETAEDAFPDVVDVVATYDDGSGTWTFAVTLTSPYDTPERYADGWRVLGPDGTVYGVHTLAHDHAAEQPFTRRQTGVEIPGDVAEVTVEGRDLVNGFGGDTITIPLPR